MRPQQILGDASSRGAPTTHERKSSAGWAAAPGLALKVDKRLLRQAAARYIEMWTASDKNLHRKYGARGFQPTAEDVSQLAVSYGVARCFPGSGAARYAGVARYLADPGLDARLRKIPPYSTSADSPEGVVKDRAANSGGPGGRRVPHDAPSHPVEDPLDPLQTGNAP